MFNSKEAVIHINASILNFFRIADKFFSYCCHCHYTLAHDRNGGCRIESKITIGKLGTTGYILRTQYSSKFDAEKPASGVWTCPKLFWWLEWDLLWGCSIPISMPRLDWGTGKFQSWMFALWTYDDIWLLWHSEESVYYSTGESMRLRVFLSSGYILIDIFKFNHYCI